MVVKVPLHRSVYIQELVVSYRTYPMLTPLDVNLG